MVMRGDEARRHQAPMYCPALADMILTHEGQHQTDCRANKKQDKPMDMTNYRNFAAYDTRGYSAGIANLQKSIAALAKRSVRLEGVHRPDKQRRCPPAPRHQRRRDIEEDIIPDAAGDGHTRKTLTGGKK